MKTLMILSSVSIFLGVSLGVWGAANERESLSAEQEVLQQLRNEVQELNLRFERTVNCVSDIENNECDLELRR